MCTGTFRSRRSDAHFVTATVGGDGWSKHPVPPGSLMSGHYSHARVPVGSVLFNPTTFDDAIEDLFTTALSRTAVGGTRLSNAWCVVIASKDDAYENLLNGPGRTFADGFPVALVVKYRAKKTATERVRGPSLFVEGLRRGRSRGLSHYFLGATPETLRRLETRAARELPGTKIAGSWSPPFGPVTDGVIREALLRIRDSRPDIVWVGMGSPKQDFIAQSIAEHSGIPAVGVGAAFDFYAGTVREAPRWMQSAGLEWLFRLVSEPRRLWRRYLLGNIRFLLIALRR